MSLTCPSTCLLTSLLASVATRRHRGVVRMQRELRPVEPRERMLHCATAIKQRICYMLDSPITLLIRWACGRRVAFMTNPAAQRPTAGVSLACLCCNTNFQMLKHLHDKGL